MDKNRSLIWNTVKPIMKRMSFGKEKKRLNLKKKVFAHLEEKIAILALMLMTIIVLVYTVKIIK